MQCIHGLKASRYPFILKITPCHCSCSVYMKNFENHGRRKKRCKIFLEHKLSLQQNILKIWISWYFSHIVVPMIANNFYVTDRESGRQDVYYYPKPIWKKLVENAITLLKNKNYSMLDRDSLQTILRERRNQLGKNTFGFSRVRFLPKEKDVRPLANLKAPCKFTYAVEKSVKRHVKPVNDQSKFVWFKSVNSALTKIRAILRRLKAEDPEKLGASVFDYNDVYQRLFVFHSQFRTRFTVFPMLYIVVADVSKAFDSIKQDKLDEIMNDVICSDTYMFRNYSKIICTKKSIKSLSDQLCYDHCKKNLDIMKCEASVQLNYCNCILIDKGTDVKVSKKMLHRVLTEHLKRNILKIGDVYYLQKVGIPQGSILSSILCSFYFGHLERNVIIPYLQRSEETCAKSYNRGTDMQLNKEHWSQLADIVSSSNSDVKCLPSGNSSKSNSNRSDIKFADQSLSCNYDDAMAGSYPDGSEVYNSFKPNNLFMRLVDDFLFISTSMDQAASFLTRLQRGFKAYNCYMNFDKFGVNFDVDEPHLSKRIYIGADGIQFIPWSGLLINCRNLEIQADYTRYWSVHMSSTITVQAYSKPGNTLGRKLCDYMRPKSHTLFYDSNINSLPTVALNAYQAFLVCAMKFHCCVRSMPGITRLNPSYILGKILFSFRYLYKLIKKGMSDIKIRFDIGPVLKLKKAELLWLGLFAYIRILKKKQSRYKELLYLLRRKLADHGVDEALPHLRYAVDDSHSSLVWRIRF
ncbi:Telomerase reverse transcriptase [Apostasia shenzhenica]|uniref:Telomerase reverse transcriptase n=1 Tax=Apostasia shenzhenica TaxID=1088818 RepID=A0A2H9ZZI7_9ASPA|nr:Telomerase reverse transcriptase [Apostasia shenzhenica]